jgi:hypothetical protein
MLKKNLSIPRLVPRDAILLLAFLSLFIIIPMKAQQKDRTSSTVRKEIQTLDLFRLCYRETVESIALIVLALLW